MGSRQRWERRNTISITSNFYLCFLLLELFNPIQRRTTLYDNFEAGLYYNIFVKCVFGITLLLDC